MYRGSSRVSQTRETRATLKDFLSSRVPDSTADTVSLSPNPGDTSPSNFVNEGDDLGVDPNTGQQLLGLTSAFVAYLTQQNAFPLNEIQEGAASVDRGSPIALAEEQGASRVFTRGGTTLGQVMSQTSNSGVQDETNHPIKTYLDKTGADQEKSGHSLLSSVVGRELDQSGNVITNTQIDLNTQSGKLQSGTVEAVVNNNRNSPESVAVSRTSTIDSVDTQQNQSLQSGFGDYQKNDSVTSNHFSYERLKNVGQWLLESAAGYTTSDLSSDQSSVLDTASWSPSSTTSNLQQIQGKIESLGEIDRDKVRPSNANTAPKGPSGESLRAGRGDYGTLNDDAEYTQPSTVTYTPETPANDQYNQKKLALSQARACYAITKLSEKIATQYNTLVKDKTPDSPKTQPDSLKSLGPYYMGSSLYGRVNAMHRMIMNLCFVPTKNSYIDAVNAGMHLMLGSSPDANGTRNQISFGITLDSPVYWNAISESALKILEDQHLPVNLPSQLGQYYKALGNSKAVKLMNAFATVGDIALQVTGKKLNTENLRTDINNAKGLESVDNLPSTAGTRISKSRDGSGKSPLSLAWRGNSVPGLYMLPDNPARASLLMGNLLTGPSPMRALLASSAVDKTYVDPAMKGEKARIPGDIVKLIEDRLDAEYVPFYFHDLRTNEIVAFHAFLETLTDSYNVNYNTYKSYGRADPIRTYGDTSRSLTVSFNVIATSRDDFDEMWFKINKLITSLYPKYTAGQRVLTDNDVKFEQPFSQVIGATPLMRLRIGDVVKSNYSRFNLSRIFGIGNEGTDVSKFEGTNKNLLSSISDFGANISDAYTASVGMKAFYALFGTPTKTIGAAFPSISQIAFNPITTNVVSNILVNGFVNPLGYKLMTGFQTSPDVPSSTNSDINFNGYAPGSVLYLKPRERPYTLLDGNQNDIGTIKVRRSLRVMIIDAVEPIVRQDNDTSGIGSYNQIKISSGVGTEKRYIVKIIEVDNAIKDAFTVGDQDQLFSENVLVTHDELMPDLGTVFAPAAATINPVSTAGDAVTALLDSVASAVNLNAGELLDNAANTGVKGFMSPNNNAVVRAFENNRGRGLAGTVKSLSFSWLDFPWEIDWGSRAPIGVKITFSFDPIHDIAPGLDSSGFMRAPTYNVGSINNALAGDPYEDNGELSRTRFAQDGASNTTKR